MCNSDGRIFEKPAACLNVTRALHLSQADVKFEGTLGVYQSSEKAVRKFCTNCGTPLVFQLVGNAKQVRSKEAVNYKPKCCCSAEHSYYTLFALLASLA